jgi:hypothetical protein
MTRNTNETSPKFRLIMRIIGIAVAVAPLLVLLVAPAPIGFSGGYVGPKGMAFMFFILSVPAGLFVMSYGKNPTRTKRILLIVAGIWAALSVISILFDVVNRAIQGTL